jgi:hypothetical protein
MVRATVSGPSGPRFDSQWLHFSLKPIYVPQYVSASFTSIMFGMAIPKLRYSQTNSFSVHTDKITCGIISYVFFSVCGDFFLTVHGAAPMKAVLSPMPPGRRDGEEGGAKGPCRLRSDHCGMEVRAGWPSPEKVEGMSSCSIPVLVFPG